MKRRQRESTCSISSGRFWTALSNSQEYAHNVEAEAAPRVRTEALERLSIVVWRMLGVSSVLDDRSRAKRTAGIVTDQLFDLLSDVDARLTPVRAA